MLHVKIKGIGIRSGQNMVGRAIHNTGNLILEDVDIFETNLPPGGGSLIDNTGMITIFGDCNIQDQ